MGHPTILVMAKTKPSNVPTKGAVRTTFRDSLTGNCVTKSSGESSPTIVVARNAKTGRFTTAKSAKSIDENVVKFADALRRLANK